MITESQVTFGIKMILVVIVAIVVNVTIVVIDKINLLKREIEVFPVEHRNESVLVPVLVRDGTYVVTITRDFQLGLVDELLITSILRFIELLVDLPRDGREIALHGFRVHLENVHERRGHASRGVALVHGLAHFEIINRRGYSSDVESLGHLVISVRRVACPAGCAGNAGNAVVLFIRRVVMGNCGQVADRIFLLTAP